MDIDAGRFVASFVGEKMEVGYFGLAFFLFAWFEDSVGTLDGCLQTCRIPARESNRLCSSACEA